MKNEIEKIVTGHSRLSPSSSHRWMICPGSIQLSEKLGNKNTSSSYAAEGNAAHNLHEKCISTGKNADKFLGDIIKIGDYEFVVTAEMASSVQISIDYINSLIFQEEILGYDVEIKIETPCSLKSLNINGLDGGTSDVIILVWIPVGHSENDTCERVLKRIDVIDYKHGAGIAVDVVDNTQLLCYALGTIFLPEIRDIDPLDGVNITISQPRAAHKDGKIRVWNVSADYIINWYRDELKPACDRVNSQNPELVADISACQFCPNISNCPKLFEIAQHAASLDFSDNAMQDTDLPKFSELTIANKTFIIQYSKLLNKFFQSVENSVCEEMKSGKTDYDEFLKLVKKQGRRKFINDALDTISSPIFDYLKYDDIYVYVQSQRSLTEIENRLKKQIGFAECKKLMQNLTTIPEPDVTVVVKSDKRPAALSSAISDFSDDNVQKQKTSKIGRQNEN